MLGKIAIDLLGAVLLVAGWYWWFRRANQRRSVQILSWIEQAFSGHGSISDAHWQSASRFQVDLRLCPSVFRRASLAVQLQPRELPLRWLLNRVHKRKETVTFKAELDHQSEPEPSYSEALLVGPDATDRAHFAAGMAFRDSHAHAHHHAIHPAKRLGPHAGNAANVCPHVRLPQRGISQASSALCGEGAAGVAVSRSPRSWNVRRVARTGQHCLHVDLLKMRSTWAGRLILPTSPAAPASRRSQDRPSPLRSTTRKFRPRFPAPVT